MQYSFIAEVELKESLCTLCSIFIAKCDVCVIEFGISVGGFTLIVLRSCTLDAISC